MNRMLTPRRWRESTVLRYALAMGTIKTTSGLGGILAVAAAIVSCGGEALVPYSDSGSSEAGGSDTNSSVDSTAHDTSNTGDAALPEPDAEACTAQGSACVLCSDNEWHCPATGAVYLACPSNIARMVSCQGYSSFQCMSCPDSGAATLWQCSPLGGGRQWSNPEQANIWTCSQ
jgi:hypothetical protein